MGTLNVYTDFFPSLQPVRNRDTDKRTDGRTRPTSGLLAQSQVAQERRRFGKLCNSKQLPVHVLDWNLSKYIRIWLSYGEEKAGMHKNQAGKQQRMAKNHFFPVELFYKQR